MKTHYTMGNKLSDKGKVLLMYKPYHRLSLSTYDKHHQTTHPGPRCLPGLLECHRVGDGVTPPTPLVEIRD